MGIRLVALDMDGTLLNSQGVMLESSIQSLIRAQESGVVVVLASGRNHFGLKKYSDQLRMTEFGGYYLGVNGQQITSLASGETRIVATIPSAVAREALAVAMKLDTEYLAVINEAIYNYYSPRLEAEKTAFITAHGLPDEDRVAGVFQIVAKQYYRNIYRITGADDLTIPFNKLVFADDPERLRCKFTAISQQLRHKLELMFVSNRWLECSPLGVSKGASLTRICGELGINLEDVVVFGDGENDLSMFEVAGTSVAMGNALDQVKQSATYVTLSNDEDGISKILEALL